MGQHIDNSKQLSGRDLNIVWQEDIDVPFGSGLKNHISMAPGDCDSVCLIGTRMIGEYVHDRWKDGAIPSPIIIENVRYGYFTADTFLETFDDSDDDIYRISVSRPTSDHIKISIPVHLRLSNILAGIYITPRSPMGVLSRIVLTAPMITTKNIITTPLSRAVVEMERLDGKFTAKHRLVGAPYDKEGANYHVNRQEGRLFGFDLETLLRIHLVSHGRDFATNIGDIRIPLPIGG